MKHQVVFFGSSAFGLPALERLSASPDITLVGVYSQPDRPTGRKQHLTPTPVAAWAKERGFLLRTPVSLKPAAEVAALKELHADTFVVAAYGLILRSDVLAFPTFGSINIHGSLLPRHRGASPVAATILAGDQTTGVSFMLMDTDIDTGPVLSQFSLPVSQTETTPSLMEKLSHVAAEHITEILHGWWAKNITPTVQNDTESTYAPVLTKQDGRADWSSAASLERKIRAYTPWPGVWTQWNDATMKLLSARALPNHTPSTPGTVVAISDVPGWAISTGDGLLVPEEVQFSGRRPQPAATIPGSYPGFIGAVLA